MDRGERSAGHREAGVALVAVLWITALLALLAAGVGSSSRTALRLAGNAAEMAKARAIADGGVHQALFELSTRPGGDPAGDPIADAFWQNGGARMAGSIATDGDVTVRIQDEDGKLDVNAISLELWQGLLSAIGLDDEAARLLADRIGDFRDLDDEALPLGAEDADYVAAGRPQVAADRPFLMLSELRDVLGMTDEVYEQLRPHITVYADVDGLDPARASRRSLEALPGMTSEMAETITTTAPGSDPLAALADSSIGELDAYFLPSRELVFSITSEGRSEQGGRFVRQAIVALDGGGGRTLPFTLYAWRRGQSLSDDF